MATEFEAGSSGRLSVDAEARQRLTEAGIADPADQDEYYRQLGRLVERYHEVEELEWERTPEHPATST